MADVVFYGYGAEGFPADDTQILTGQISGDEAEVTFEGPNEFSVGQGLSPTERDTVPEITDPAVVVFDNAGPLAPDSLTPNENEIAFYVVDSTTTSITVRAVASDGSGVPTNLLLYQGVHAPSGLCGKTLEFTSPTTASSQAITAMMGTRRVIASHTPTGFNFVDPIPLPGLTGPTLTDRLLVRTSSQLLRRTPVLEILLG